MFLLHLKDHWSCRLFISQSPGSKRTVHLDSLRWPRRSGQNHPLHQPLALKCLTLSVLIPFHSRLFAQNHIHDQTWPDPIKVMLQSTSAKPSDTSVIPQRWQLVEKKKPILLSWFLERERGDTEQRDERIQTSRKDLQGKGSSALGLVWSHRNWASQPSPWAEPT